MFEISVIFRHKMSENAEKCQRVLPKVHDIYEMIVLSMYY